MRRFTLLPVAAVMVVILLPVSCGGKPAIKTPTPSAEQPGPPRITTPTTPAEQPGPPVITPPATPAEQPSAPVVVTTHPQDGAKLVLQPWGENDFEILFSQPMDEAAAAQAVSLVLKIPTSDAYDAYSEKIYSSEIDYHIWWPEGRRLMLIRPTKPWPDPAIYKLTIAREARSEDGLYMEEDYNFSFELASRFPC